MKHFDEWSILKQNIDNKIERPPVKKGSVYWCSVGENVGVEYNGKGKEFLRPVLVLKKYSNEVIFGVPLTTKIKNSDWYYTLPHSINNEISVVVLNQAKTYDVKRFGKSITQVSEKTVTLVLQKLFELLTKK